MISGLKNYLESKKKKSKIRCDISLKYHTYYCYFLDPTFIPLVLKKCKNYSLHFLTALQRELFLVKYFQNMKPL